YYRKQAMQLGSKLRFLSVQFIAMLEGDLWRRNALQANRMAQLLAEKVRDIPEIKITQKVQANGVFAIVPRELIAPLQQEYFFYVWDEKKSEVRWMTSFDTTEDDISGFVTSIKKLLK
ncbi:MAG: threonine aldolase, partial [Candidatus Cloacimonetes bacterium]|nr:threonine aldolase [Candidatus Cloacimonadota bacterium]